VRGLIEVVRRKLPQCQSAFACVNALIDVGASQHEHTSLRSRARNSSRNGMYEGELVRARGSILATLFEGGRLREQPTPRGTQRSVRISLQTTVLNAFREVEEDLATSDAPRRASR